MTSAMFSPVVYLVLSGRSDGTRVKVHCNWALFKRETEHLCLRQPIHGIAGNPFHLPRVGR